MRFRTQLRQPRLLTQALQVLARVSKDDVVWKLSERRLILVAGGGTGAVSVVCTINTSQVMEAMRIESKQANQIYLKLNVAPLIRVLKPAERARDVSMKLGVCKTTRKPVLQFSMSLKSSTANAQDLMQEIPVCVMSDDEVGDMIVPDCAEIGSNSVSLFLPPLSDVRPFVEKMSKITDRIQATAIVLRGEHGESLPNGGVLELRTQTPLFSSATQYKNLAVCKTEGGGGGGGGSDAAGPSEAAAGGSPQQKSESCIVDTKKLLSILDVDKIAPSQVLAYFTPNNQLVVHATANGELTILFQMSGLS